MHHFPFGEFFDIIGNVWQWTESPITGFDGFQVHPYYDDFSTPTFDTQHNLIKGGSWISTGNEATRDSPYGFRRHFFQHAGLRYVQSEQPLTLPDAMYETDAAVSQYCEFHYGPTYFEVPNFAVRCAAVCGRYTRQRPRRKAFDLGCAVGRATFELAKEFELVTGIDFSARFIRVALQLKEKGVAHFELVEEGEAVSYHEARLDELGSPARAEERIEAQPAEVRLPASPAAPALSMEERLRAQRAIEEVHWRHRIWPKENRTPKPPLSAVASDEAIRAKVEDYLKKSNALETWWQRPVTAAQLQAELDRMSKGTRDPGMLRELYAALGNDALLIAETLARPTLVDG